MESIGNAKHTFRFLGILCISLYINLLTISAQITLKPSSFSWHEMSSPSNPFRYNTALIFGHQIFVVGGDNNGAFEVLDTETEIWSSLKPLPEKRYFHSAAMSGAKIFVIGGIDSNLNYSSSVYTYDINLGTWEKSESLPSSSSRSAAVEFDGDIFLFGGLEGKNDRSCNNSSSVFKYSPNTHLWEKKMDMPTARHGHSAIRVGELIYVIGGYSQGKLSTVEIYNPKTNNWHTGADMPTARGFFGLIQKDTLIYALGGRVPGTSGPIEAYNPNTNTWTRLEDMPYVRNRFGICSLGDTIYIIGGEDAPKSVLKAKISHKSFTTPFNTILTC